MVGFFTIIPPCSAIDVVHQALLKDTTPYTRTNLSCNQICDLLHLCLDNTYFSYNDQLYQQCHGCAMGSPVSSIVSNLYVEQCEHLSLSTYLYTGLQSWYRYVTDIFVVLHSDENDTSFRHINAAGTVTARSSGRSLDMRISIHARSSGRSLDMRISIHDLASWDGDSEVP